MGNRLVLTDFRTMASTPTFCRVVGASPMLHRVSMETVRDQTHPTTRHHRQFQDRLFFFLTRNVRKGSVSLCKPTALDSGNRIKWQVTSTNNLRRRRCVAITPQSRPLLQERECQRKPGWRTSGGGKPVAHAQPARVELTWLWPWPVGSQTRKPPLTTCLLRRQ